MATHIALVGTLKVIGKRPPQADKKNPTIVYPARAELGWEGGSIDPEIPAELYDKVPTEGYVRAQIEFTQHPRFGVRIGKLVTVEPVGDPAAARGR